MHYVFLGRELGARSDDPACYDETGRVQYDRLARKPAFRRGLDRIVQETARNCIALMCAEKEPLSCHRTILVAPALERRGVEIQHILADGTLEPHARALQRLIDSLKLPPTDLFRSRRALIAEALARRAARIGYVNPELATVGASSRKNSKKVTIRILWFSVFRFEFQSRLDAILELIQGKGRDLHSFLESR